MLSSCSASFPSFDKRISSTSPTGSSMPSFVHTELILFSKIDLDGKGYVDQSNVIAAVQKDGEGQNYDEIRATLRECNIDASGRVELEDYVEVSLLLEFA